MEREFCKPTGESKGPSLDAIEKETVRTARWIVLDPQERQILRVKIAHTRDAFAEGRPDTTPDLWGPHNYVLKLEEKQIREASLTRASHLFQDRLQREYGVAKALFPELSSGERQMVMSYFDQCEQANRILSYAALKFLDENLPVRKRAVGALHFLLKAIDSIAVARQCLHTCVIRGGRVYEAVIRSAEDSSESALAVELSFRAFQLRGEIEDQLFKEI